MTNKELKAKEIELQALQELLRIREAELRECKGPCSNLWCWLHYAHSGPCDTRPK